MQSRPSIQILGTRGIPSSHGGFETFAQHLALFLVERDWHVSVYCQDEVPKVAQRLAITHWRGVELRHIAVSSDGPRATLEFDWHCVRDAARHDGVCLVLGYNGAAFLPYLRLHGRKIITNMDGIEWRRPKWGMAARAWFWANEWIAAWTSHRLVADHPAIADHVATRRGRHAISMIPYGGDPVENASETPVRDLGLEPGDYLVSIARLEPDNNILTLVNAFSRKRRGKQLAILGTVDIERDYHREILAAASDEVIFPGAIYEAETLASLRFHARAYVHGHMVGGTNPSLVEALWAGNAVIAHDNKFNRWTAGGAARFFDSDESCEALIEQFLHDDELIQQAQRAARHQAEMHFNWIDILEAYEREAERLLGSERRVRRPALDDTADSKRRVEPAEPGAF